MELDMILKKITSGLTGNAEQDAKYLQEQMEKYKEHELNKEILRACGRIMFEIMPDDKQKAIKQAIDNDTLGIDETLKEIRFNVFDGNVQKAYSISKSLVEKIEDAPMFENDTASEYYTFNEIFQEILFDYYHQTDKEIRTASIPFSEIFYVHGNILFELKKMSDARAYLKKALRWNPASCKVAFEYIETFKVEKNYDEFYELTKKQFKYAYRVQDIARCYRNLGFILLKKKNILWHLAAY